MKAIEIFTKNIDRAENLFSAHRNAFPKGRPPRDWTSDILRASLVFAATALDAYMHDKLSQVIPILIKNKRRSLPGNFIEALKQKISYEKLITILFEERPLIHFRTAIKKYYEERTIQDTGDIDKALKVLGISDFWFKLANELNKRMRKGKKLSKKSAKKIIHPFISRRNKIVHEGDLNKYHRLVPIKINFVKGGIKNIRLFVNAVDKIIDREYP